MNGGNFKVEELIGRGGQAKVYRVVYQNENYALKIFRYEKHFRRELGILKMIK